jgi:predicted enzyme related to lactoylglutathione lyase
MATSNVGRFVWYEHITKNVPAAIAFYTDVIGWKTQPFGQGEEYTMWVGSQGPLGGVIALPDQLARTGVPPHWMSHVVVENVDASAAQVKKLGGKVWKEPEDIPTVGRFAVVADPQGATLSLFTPAGGPMELHDPSKDGEFCWNELVTSDSAAAFQFYAQLFGWKVQQDLDMGAMGTYRIYGVGETGLGGMMKLPPGAPMPPSWIYYVNVSDLEATIARATARHARILNGPMEVPGGGRIAQLADPQGATFALHQPPREK